MPCTHNVLVPNHFTNCSFFFLYKIVKLLHLKYSKPKAMIWFKIQDFYTHNQGIVDCWLCNTNQHFCWKLLQGCSALFAYKKSIALFLLLINCTSNTHKINVSDVYNVLMFICCLVTLYIVWKMHNWLYCRPFVIVYETYVMPRSVLKLVWQ